MFRFSMDPESAKLANEKQLISHGVGRDDDWPESMEGTGEYRDDETYFRADQTTPESLEDAVSFVQGIFGAAPERVWLGGEMFEVNAELTDRSEKTRR